jgi:hypothetical protein
MHRIHKLGVAKTLLLISLTLGVSLLPLTTEAQLVGNCPVGSGNSDRLFPEILTRSAS